jgi:hypothetical protein
MSLFKERAASGKRVIALQNEIIALKNKISSASTGEASISQDQLDELVLANENNATKISLLEEGNSSLKTEVKKLKSENTRAKKKLAAAETTIANLKLTENETLLFTDIKSDEQS